jgi:hypothetical protein
MADIAKLAKIYSNMVDNITKEGDLAEAELRKEKGEEFKESMLDQVEMITTQQLMAAEQMFIQMVSNVSKSEENADNNTIQNMK